MNHQETRRVGFLSNKYIPSKKSGFDACISSRITTVIHVVGYHQINYNWFNEPYAVSQYRYLYLDMHGLIFETSIWLLAGSTRYLTREFHCWNTGNARTRPSTIKDNTNGPGSAPRGRLLRNHIRSCVSFVPLYVDTEKMIHKNPSGRGVLTPHTKPLWPRYRFLVTYVPRRLLRSSCLPFIRSAHPSSNSMLQVCLVFVLPRKAERSNREYSISKRVKIRNESSIVWIVSMSDKQRGYQSPTLFTNELDSYSYA